MRRHHYINGIEVNDPINHAELFIELNYDTDSIQQAVTNEWEIGVGDSRQPNDGFLICRDWIDKGLTGGVGVTEGIPFKLTIDNEKGTVYNLFDGYLDLWSAKIELDRITATATEQGKLDWLNDVADKFSFEYLYESVRNRPDSGGPKPGIKASDFVAVPYVINRKQNGFEIIICIASIYSMVQQLIQRIEYLLDTINDYDIIYISTIIRIIAQIIQLAILIAAIIALAKDLYNMLVQPIKYHYGMYAHVLLRKGLEYLGLKFSSSILEKAPYNELLIIPEKYSVREDNTGDFANVFGHIQPRAFDKLGFYRGTFGQLLRLLNQMFYAKIIIDDGVLYFEKQDYRLPKPAYVLPPVEDSGYLFNHDDFYSNIVLSFSHDLQDRNTIQEFTGTSVQIITLPKAIGNAKMNLTRNLQEINFGFALGKRKTSLSATEKLLEKFNKLITNRAKTTIKVIEGFQKMIGNFVKSVNKFLKALKVVGIKPKFNLKVPKMPLLSTITKQMEHIIEKFDGTRIGMLKMESDYIAIPKMILVKEFQNSRQNKLSAGNEKYLNAKYLWENFHDFKSFVMDRDGNHNQYLIKELPKIPFTFEDFEKVRLSNFIFDSDMNEGRLLSLKMNPDEQTATGRYKINQQYTANLYHKIIEPDGR